MTGMPFSGCHAANMSVEAAKQSQVLAGRHGSVKKLL
jgi:hypothetical protein